MRKFLRNFLLLPILLLAHPHDAAAATAIAGRWLTEDRGGVIEILPCGPAFCGRIIGMAEPRNADGSMSVDSNGQPKCGLTILNGATETEPGKWDGHITDPDNGKVYDTQLSVDAQGRLHLRGYVLIPLLGETQIWTAYSGSIGPECRIG